MGIVLGVEAGVAVVEAAEAAATAADAGEGIASAAEAGEAIESGASTGSEAGTAAGEDAGQAAAEGESALSKVVKKLVQVIQKLFKIVNDYLMIDSVFKEALKILKALSSDPGVKARAKKLEKLIGVLVKSGEIVKDITQWFKEHTADTTTIGDYVLTLQGVLSRFVPYLGAAAATLVKLGDQVAKDNSANKPITNEEVDALEKGLHTTINKALKPLAQFKAKHEAKIAQLKTMPIDEKKVADLQAQMP